MGNQLPRAGASNLGTPRPSVDVLSYRTSDSRNLDTADSALKLRMRAAAETTLTKDGFVYTVTVAGVPTALLGLVPGTDRSANIWFHTVNGEERTANPIAFLRASKRIVDAWLKHFDILYNVMETCDPSIAKWLRFLGADVTACPEEGTTTFTISRGVAAHG